MIASDSKGNLWVVSLRGGIFRFEPNLGNLLNSMMPQLISEIIGHKSLYIDRHDKIWITSDGSGFFSYDPGINKFEHFGSKGDGKGTNQQILLDIMPEDENHLLIAVDQGGINRFNIISKHLNISCMMKQMKQDLILMGFGVSTKTGRYSVGWYFWWRESII